ncbi:MAG TPA: DUF4124 domain-containing protein [Aquabacterium sp.]|nr:DUF4124 domain-containing protein [Aquabacterium sp.]HRH27547.1 DUF4124 domain-containing protein [Aquabacterium sp.]
MRLTTIARIGAVFLTAAVLCTPTLSAQWKWRDAQGRIQYSDRPPPADVQDNQILTRPRSRPVPLPSTKAADEAPASAAKPALKASDPQLEAQKKKLEEAEAAKKKAEEAKRNEGKAEACQRARNYEKSLTDGLRISRTNNKGEREILDDQGRASELARTREIIGDTCR